MSAERVRGCEQQRGFHISELRLEFFWADELVRLLGARPFPLDELVPIS